MDAISKVADGKDVSVVYIVEDRKCNSLSMGEAGHNEFHMEALASVFASPLIDTVMEHILPQLPEEAVEHLYDLLDEHFGEVDAYAFAHKDSPCSECALFNEKGHGFGNCPYHEDDFDGEEANKQREDGGCIHFYEVRDGKER